MQRMVHRGHRQFNGQRFWFYEQFSRKTDANRSAHARRSNGYLVRIITMPGLDGYFLFERKIGLRGK